MKEQHGRKRTFLPVLGNAVLLLLGLDMALGFGRDVDENLPHLAST